MALDQGVLTNLLYELDAKQMLRLPFGAQPAFDRPVSKAIWESTSWNPPYQRFTMPHPDPQASPKPTWTQLVAWYESYVAPKPERLLADLRQAAQHAITAAYGATDWQDEITLRLRSGHTAEQDEERERLRVRYQATKAAISLASSVSELQALEGQVKSGKWADEPKEEEPT